MDLEPTRIEGLFVANSNAHQDPRGAFLRCFCQTSLENIVGDRRILQINHSQTNEVGAVRGLHFQYPPCAEMKMVRCIRGRVWDVAVDIRKGSRTFLNWHAEELSSQNNRMMVIPEGFAHGFQVLEPESALLYLHTDFYNSNYEGGLRFDDSQLGIPWPLAVRDLSERDQRHPLLIERFEGVSL